MGILSTLFGKRGGSPIPLSAAIGAIVNRPMLMSPQALDTLLATAMSMPQREGWRDDDDWTPEGSKPEHLIELSGDIGILRIEGPLFHRWSIWTWYFGGTGYDMIVAAHAMLLADDRVREIVHLHDSGGGQCSGCFDAADAIFESRGAKPITAIVSDAAYSASYALASAADRIVISRTGGVGSIGVRATHLDVSAWDERVGLKYTTIIDGERKADFDAHAELSDPARADLQAEVSRLAVLFRDTVARNRGIDVAAIEAQQAGCYYADAAIAAGLADSIGTLDATLSAMSAASDTLPVESDPPASDSSANSVIADAESEVDKTVIEGKTASASLIELKVLPDNPTAEDITAARVELTKAFEMANGDAEAVALLEAIRTDLDAVEASGKELSAAQAEIARAADRAQVLTAVMAATLRDDLTVALLEESAGVTPETVAARIEHARAVADLCAAAGLRGVEADYVKKNTKIETIRAQLIEAKAEDGPEIVTTLPENALQSPDKVNSTEIYSRRRAAAAGNGTHPRQ